MFPPLDREEEATKGLVACVAHAKREIFSSPKSRARLWHARRRNPGRQPANFATTGQLRASRPFTVNLPDQLSNEIHNVARSY
jgi:hypothetical protein